MSFDTTKLPFLNFRDEKQFNDQIQELKKYFRSNENALIEVFKKGDELKEIFIEMDPMLQELTQKICPYCGNVCCANRHGLPEFADIVAFLAMKEEPPTYKLNVDLRAICQFLSKKGCILPRYRRPYRCTWYFCEPMLLEVDIGPIKRYKEFLRLVKAIAQKRGELLQEFYQIYREYK